MKYKVFISSVQREFSKDFELVEQAVDFVMSRIDIWTGLPDSYKTAQAETKMELPWKAVREAIVNAVCHRDYTSNGSVQVMLFKDRLEIWNPGTLPQGLTPEKLQEPHPSLPVNPLLAEAMFWKGYIERVGSGTEDIIRQCEQIGLRSPEFHAEDFMRVVIWRPIKDDADYAATPQVTPQVASKDTATPKVTPKVIPETVPKVTSRIVLFCSIPRTSREIMNHLGLKDKMHFHHVLTSLLISEILELTQPNARRSPTQKYRLTAKGEELKKQLEHDGQK